MYFNFDFNHYGKTVKVSKRSVREITHRRAGGSARHRDRRPVLGAELRQSSLGGVGTLFSVLQFVLHLAELGQVHSSDLLL